MPKKISWVFICLCLASYAYTSFDVETLPSRRTRQYPMGSYDKIAVFSASRTGSSLVYNIFKFLFEDQKHLSDPHNNFNLARSVLKTHRQCDIDLLSKTNTLYIVPIRNPLHACISNFRIRTHPTIHIQRFCKNRLAKQKNSLLFAEKLKESGCDVVFLRYEDFANNPHYLISFIEDHFKIDISQADRDLMMMGYDKENIYACTAMLPDFGKYLPISGFHGKHVTLGKYSPPETLLKWLHFYIKDVAPTFRRYGYFQNNSVAD